MLTSFHRLMAAARKGGYAVGAFNIYNLEGALAVMQAADEMSSPVMLQILPSALDIGGSALVKLCLELGRQASVPVAVHLDHCSSAHQIRMALDAGVCSVMADGSGLAYAENLAFTRQMAGLARQFDADVEAELGKLSGSEDGLAVSQRLARMTDPDQAVDFVQKTGVSALAVCIGNVHGKYRLPPDLDFGRLDRIRNRVDLPLVLHGTSGLPGEMVKRAMDLGVCKFNVNTEVRKAYLGAMENALGNKPELVGIMNQGIRAMTAVVKEKITLFNSAGKAG